MKRIMIADSIVEIGENVKVCGWVDNIRPHGKILFIDLRDASGLLQIVFHGDISEEAFETAKKLHHEYVVEIQGKVKERGKNFINMKLLTGKIEMEGEELTILNVSQIPPIDIKGDGLEIEEKLRLKYRYLDLRRPRMYRNLKKKNEVTSFIRNFLGERGFLEIETPLLTKSTPEGARDFLVPSRLQPGKFYALPQSPQQYKQLLMVAGVDKYFQLARCFRDEDPRKDRAYGEFTQLDMEMSFVEQEDILKLTEELFTKMVETVFPEKHISQKPWPRLSHKEAMEKYQTDKPDLRKDKNDPDELAFSWTLDFPLFAKQTEEDYFHGSGAAKFAPSHHMFTAPHPDDLKLLKTNPLKVRGLQHDLVLNGFEVGGGSIRIHDAKVQEEVFDLIGFSAEQKQEFHHMLEAFTYGVPPHGGIAPGIDRFLMTVLGEPSIREVIAFPAISSGQTAVMSAPSKVSEKQLQELHIKTVKK